MRTLVEPRRTRSLVRLAVTALLVAALAACGGPGSTSSRSEAPAAKPAGHAQPPAGPAGGNSAAAAKRDLDRDEEQGGHTLRQHVGKTDAELKLRLEGEDISGASTYTDLDTAESIVAAALAGNSERIAAWVNRPGTHHPNLVLHFQSDHVIGRTLPRDSDTPVSCDQALVVLKWSGPGQFYVLTSYPNCS